MCNSLLSLEADCIIASREEVIRVIDKVHTREWGLKSSGQRPSIEGQNMAPLKATHGSIG